MHRHPIVKNTVVALVLSIGLTLSTHAQAPDPVGVWNLQTDVQGQATSFTLTITREGDALKGKIASEEFGSQDLTDLKFENGTLMYTRNLDLGGQAIAMEFKGKIEADKLTGAYSIQGVELPVTGTRKSSADTPQEK